MKGPQWTGPDRPDRPAVARRWPGPPGPARTIHESLAHEERRQRFNDPVAFFMLQFALRASKPCRTSLGPYAMPCPVQKLPGTAKHLEALAKSPMAEGPKPFSWPAQWWAPELATLASKEPVDLNELQMATLECKMANTKLPKLWPKHVAPERHQRTPLSLAQMTSLRCTQKHLLTPCILDEIKQLDALV